MECPKCNSLYKKERNIPLLLIKCGHTLCDSCADTIFTGKSIVCPECGSESLITSVASLPKNMALLSMFQPVASPHPNGADTICKQHKKKLEAFCLDDRTLLCIDCILLEGHKSHDISSISQAYDKERASLQKDLETTSKLEETLTLLVSDMENFRTELIAKANTKREKVTAVFKEITNVIHERESLLKQNISNILEKEEEALLSTSSQIKEHLNCITAFKASAAQIQSESACALLEKSRERKKQSLEANKPPPTVTFNANFPDVKKENELSVLWKMLCPQLAGKPGSNLYATTASYANKRIDKARPNTGNHGIQQKPTKERRKPLPPTEIEKMLSPRREQKVPAVDFSKQSQMLNTSGLSYCSSTKTPVPVKEESKAYKGAEAVKCEGLDNSLAGQKRQENTETVVLESCPMVPTTLITMQQKEGPNIEDNKDSVVPLEVISKHTPNDTPKDMQDRMRKPGQDFSATTASVLPKETISLVPSKTPSTNDIFTTLREKRERHKKEKETKGECKVDSEALKELSINTSGSATPVITIVDAAGKQDKNAGIEKTPDSKLQSNKGELGGVKREDTFTSVLPKIAEGYGSLLNSAQKTQYTPSVTPSLFDLYVNAEECDRMDLHSLLGGTSQYIYAFCNFPIIINVAGYGETGLCACEKYDLQQAIWKETKSLTKPRSKFTAVCTLDGQALIMGGKFLDGTRTDLIEKYNPTTNEWVTFPVKLTRSKSSLAAVCTAMGVYVCGGSDGHILRTCEKLDLATNQWKSLENMKYKREEHGFTMGPDRKLYAVGGFNGKSCIRTAERYNIETNTWEEIAPLCIARRSLCAVALPDGVYVLGGYDGEKYLSSVEKYDIERNEWTVVRSMNHPRCTMACVSSPDCRSIYALGGYDGTPLNLVERYDVVHDTWEFVTPMKYKRFMHAAVIASANM